jgi:hypothetical protein
MPDTSPSFRARPRATVRSVSPDKIFIEVNSKRTSLAKFLAMDSAEVKTVYARGCTALTELKADAAKTVDASGCTALTESKAPRAIVDRKPDYCFGGVDSRGYLFESTKVRGQWRIVAGCRNFSITDARKHWGRGGPSDRPDCLALHAYPVDAHTRQNPLDVEAPENDRSERN